MRAIWALAIATFFLPGVARADQGARPLLRTGQPEVQASLLSVGADWRFQFQTYSDDGAAGEKAFVPAAELVAWGSPVDELRPPIVVLADGSQIVTGDPNIEPDVVSFDGRQWSLVSPTFDAATLPTQNVRGILFTAPAGRHEADLLLHRATTYRGETDRVLLANGDELTGNVVSVKSGDDANDGLMIELETDVGRVELAARKIAAVMLAAPPPEVEGQPRRAWVGFRDGSLLVAIRLVVGKDQVELELRKGITLSTDLSDDIVFVQPMGHGITYLSDLEDAGYRHVPFLSLEWPYMLDRNVRGGRARAGRAVYPKNLGMHSASRLTYRLDQPFRRLEAEVAIDDDAGQRGSVVFRVFVNSGNKWRQAYSSEIIRGGQPPVPMSVDLTGVRAISLLVEFADQGDTLDHANWLNARLAR